MTDLNGHQVFESQGAIDVDAGMAAARLADTETAHWAAEQALFSELANTQEAQKVFGAGDNSSSIAPEFWESSTQAAGQPPDPAAKSSGSEGANKPAATGLESALARMTLDTKRQEAFVTMGDPAVLQRCHLNMAADGKLAYIGGSPVMRCSLRQAQDYYKRAAKDLGLPCHAAVDLTFPRGGAGVVGSILSRAQNALGQKDRFVVMVAGAPAAEGAAPTDADKAWKDLGSLLQKMQDKNLLANTVDAANGKLEFADGRLVLQEGPDGKTVPLKLEGSDRLFKLVDLASTAVREHSAQEASKKAERAAFKDAEIDKKIADSKKEDKTHGATTDQDSKARAGDSSAEPPNKHSEKLADRIAEVVATPALLTEPDAKRPQQETVAGLMHQVKGLKDPSEAEFATLPADKRQAMLVQLDAISVKAVDGEFAPSTKAALDKAPKDGGPTFREKLSTLVALEHARDPEFAAKARDIAECLVADGFLKEGHLAKLTTLQPSMAAEKSVVEAAPAGPLAAKEPASADAIWPKQEPTLQPGGAAFAHGEVGAEVSVQTRLLDKLAAITQAGPQALTGTEAASILAQLDGVRSRPLAQVDPNSGEGPTKTLTQIEGILSSIAADKFDRPTVALAGSLREVVAAWKAEDVQRYATDPILAPGTAEAVAEKYRKESPAWHPEPSREGSAKQEPLAEAATRYQQRQVELAELERKLASAVGQAPTRNPQAQPVVSGSADRPGLAEPAPRSTAGAGDLPASTKAAADSAAAVARLARLSNPAGALTRTDKTWNVKNIATTVRAVSRLSSADLTNLSPSVRADTLAYSKWVVSNASSGRLPGFESAEGRMLLEDAKGRLADLAHLGGGPVSETAAKGLRLADKMVSSRETLDRDVSRASESSVRSSAPAIASVEIAKDLVHAVFKEPELSDAHAKYLLKTARHLTPEAINTLDTETKARAAVALDFLAQKVSSGAVGEFNELSQAVRQYTVQSMNRADALFEAYSADPKMSTPLTKASFDLAARTGSLDRGTEAQSSQAPASGRGFNR